MKRIRILLAAAMFLPPLLAAPPLEAARLNQTSSLADQASPAEIPSPNAPRFAKVIEDLPLMPGLQLVEDEDVLFSEPGAGRIAETNAIGSVDVDDVYRFYRRSLPHLGWKPLSMRAYWRNHEELNIQARANEKITVVRFTIRPAS